MGVLTTVNAFILFFGTTLCVAQRNGWLSRPARGLILLSLLFLIVDVATLFVSATMFRIESSEEFFHRLVMEPLTIAVVMWALVSTFDGRKLLIRLGGPTSSSLNSAASKNNQNTGTAVVDISPEAWSEWRDSERPQGATLLVSLSLSRLVQLAIRPLWVTARRIGFDWHVFRLALEWNVQFLEWWCLCGVLNALTEEEALSKRRRVGRSTIKEVGIVVGVWLAARVVVALAWSDELAGGMFPMQRCAESAGGMAVLVTMRLVRRSPKNKRN